MMGKFHRYVLFELTKSFLAMLLASTSLMLLLAVAREASNQGLSPGQILRILPYLLPETLRFTLPAAVLFAACGVYGKMSAMNEVVALKSLGVNPLKLLTPLILFSLALSVAACALNDLAVVCRQRVERTLIEDFDDILLGLLKAQRSYSARNMSILVKRVEGDKLISPIFTIRGENTPSVKVAADEAVFRVDAENMLLVLQFQRGTVEVGNNTTVQVLDVFEHTIPLSEIKKSGLQADHPTAFLVAKIPAEIVKQRELVETTQVRMAAMATQSLLTGDFARLGAPSSELAAIAVEHKYQIERLHRLETEVYRRYATGFSCLCFALVGAPLAILWRSAEILQTFFLCFAPVLVLYYPLIMVGLDWAKLGFVPPYTVWVANVVFLLWGVFLIRKVIRY